MSVDEWKPSDAGAGLKSYAGKRVGVICEECEILKFFEGDALIAKHGNVPMPTLLETLAKENLGCQRTENKYYERCKLTYHHSPEEWARRRGYVKPEDARKDDRAIGELAEWEGMVAFCGDPKCKRKQPLDRWALQKRLGKHTKISTIGPRLKCKCGHRGARIVIGYVSR
ncbi:hypothetical protein Rleg9DRAFT_1676 [Rhizobium leguminosarum bv. trifolii WSM597]|uniref:Uncharacterized protein n=1 Tax=Rhizobium leguminosarum bv. trifolii WSM597 TaxID=754764 RepID=I9N847_RHILT|nr:hypothetical protein [Rhizobium leguminosarum]EJB02862.1 hypothetical protein Rleg9DRAFT_1676 [Rhizobium leguminosarum bv. trifolii WSM597]